MLKAELSELLPERSKAALPQNSADELLWKPNLFLVGAMRGGSTTVYKFISSSPEVFEPEIKEPNFFATDLHRHPHAIMASTIHSFATQQWITNYSRYKKLYARGEAYKYRVDASTTYLYSTEASKNIIKFNPDAKVIVLLRNPINRAWSEYKMNRAIGIENRDFRSAIASELSELRKGQHFLFKRYIYAGLYSEQIQRYISAVPPANLHIEIVDYPGYSYTEVINNVKKFLNIHTIQDAAFIHEHLAQEPKHALLNHLFYLSGGKMLASRLLPKFLKLNLKSSYYQLDNSQAPQEMIVELKDIFAPDIQKLEVLIGKSLAHWHLT